MTKLLENAKKSKVQLLVEGNKIKAMKGRKLLEMYELENGDDLIEVMDEIMEELDPYMEEEVMTPAFEDTYVPEVPYEDVMDEFQLECSDNDRLEGEDKEGEDPEDTEKEDEEEKDDEKDEKDEEDK